MEDDSRFCRHQPRTSKHGFESGDEQAVADVRKVGARHFQGRAEDGHRHVLRHGERKDEWTVLDLPGTVT